MNKSDLIEVLSEKSNLSSKQSEEVINLIFSRMKNALIDHERIEIRGFGSFMVKDYSGYLGRNPKTGDKIEVKSKKMPFFKVGKNLRERVDG